MSRQGLIEECLERLCQKGCGQVWRDISALEKGESLPEAAGLSVSERRQLLAELKSIMQVYSYRCRVE
jgi:hypothetical protein